MIFEAGNPRVTGRLKKVRVRHRLADPASLRVTGRHNGVERCGQIRLGLCMPPIGSPLQGLLVAWNVRHPKAGIIFYEANDRAILPAIQDRSLDAALMAQHAAWPQAATAPLYSERILLAVPRGHRLAGLRSVSWNQIREETVLVQGWDNRDAAPEFYASFLGGDVKYQSHAVSKQTIMALVAAKYGVTLVTKSQAEVRFPNLAYRPIAEDNAWVQMALVWALENDDAVVNSFVAFMRHEAQSRGLL